MYHLYRYLTMFRWLLLPRSLLSLFLEMKKRNNVKRNAANTWACNRNKIELSKLQKNDLLELTTILSILSGLTTTMVMSLTHQLRGMVAWFKLIFYVIKSVVIVALLNAVNKLW